MKKDYFSQISNRLIEKLAKTNLSPYEGRYLFALLRKTFGWGKDFDYIANSQFADITGIKRPHISRTEIKLLGRKIITCRGNEIGFNMEFNQWLKLPTEVIITRKGKTITYKGNKKLPGAVATKENKEIIQKKSDSSFGNNLEILEAYKKGDRKYKPFYMDYPMRWVKHEQRWYVIKNGEWSEFGTSQKEIKWELK